MKKIILIIFLTVVVFSTNCGFSALEIDRNITRQEYLGNGLGKIYKNRFGVFYFKNIYPKLTKFETKLFSNLSRWYLYLPLFVLLIYTGYKKYGEK